MLVCLGPSLAAHSLTTSHISEGQQLREREREGTLLFARSLMPATVTAGQPEAGNLTLHPAFRKSSSALGLSIASFQGVS